MSLPCKKCGLRGWTNPATGLCGICEYGEGNRPHTHPLGEPDVSPDELQRRNEGASWIRYGPGSPCCGAPIEVLTTEQHPFCLDEDYVRCTECDRRGQIFFDRHTSDGLGRRGRVHWNDDETSTDVAQTRDETDKLLQSKENQ